MCLLSRSVVAVATSAILASMLLIPSGLAQPQEPDRCSDIIREGLKTKYNLTTFASYNSAFKKALCYSKEQYESLKNSGSTDISIPIAEALFSFGSSSDQERIQQLRVKYCTATNVEISSTDLMQLAIDTLPTAQVDAWRECMKGKNQAMGGQWDIEGFGKNINFLLRWGPSPGVYSAKVGNMFILGAKCQKQFLQNKVVSSQWLAMPCQRDTDGKEVSIVIQFKPTTLGSISAGLPAAIQSAPPLLPACQYQIAWKQKDIAGNEYKERFPITLNGPGVQRDGLSKNYRGTHFLSNSSGRITRVDYNHFADCVGPGCGFSYNPEPNPPGTIHWTVGYRPWLQIAADKKSFMWRRRWQNSLGRTETYTAYYELPEQSCANCPNCK